MGRPLLFALTSVWVLTACGSDGTVTPSSVGDLLADTSMDTASDDAPESLSGLAPGEVTLVTNMGAITIALNTDLAPVTTANFLQYVDEGFYDGDDGKGPTTFHRVISGFMVQGGGLTSAGQTKSTHAPIVNESTNGLLNTRGTVAMARTDAPHSATSQFFINHADNAFLNYEDTANPGYAVFAEVVDGMDVVDAIAALPTSSDDQPLEIVLIADVLRWDD